MSELFFIPGAASDILEDIQTLTFGPAPVSNALPGATPNIDWTAGQKQEITLSANITGITFTAPPGIGNFMLVIKQPGGANYTVTGWPGTVNWPGGTAPTITAVNAAVDVLSFYWDGTDYYGQFAQNFF